MVKARIKVPPRWLSGKGIASRMNWILLTSVFLTSLLALPVEAAKWEIVPTVSVEEMYTDNVALSPRELQEDSWITTIDPAVAITATGARLKLKAIYDPEIISYSRGDTDYKVYQRGDLVSTAELARQLLYLDTGANINQYDASLHGPITAGNDNLTGNRATVWTYYGSPYIRRDFGSAVQAEARYTYSVVNAGTQSAFVDDALSDSTANRVNLRLKSGPAYKLLTWNVDAVGETVNYDSGEYSVTRVATAGVRRLITPTIGLLAQAGYEQYKSQYQSVDLAPGTDGASWSTGFDWTPSPRTHLAATVGHRFYGSAYSLDFSHRSRLTTWGIQYSENVTSSRSGFFVPATTSTVGYLDILFSAQFPDPAARQRAVQEFIARTGLPASLSDSINFFSTQLFLAKRWQASTGLLGVRNVVILDVYRESRDALVGNLVLPGAGDFATSNNIIQTGASVLWNFRLSALDAWNMRASYSRNEFPGLQEIDHFIYLGMGFSRQFDPRFFGSLNYRNQHSYSNIATSYTENAVIASVQYRF